MALLLVAIAESWVSAPPAQAWNVFCFVEPNMEDCHDPFDRVRHEWLPHEDAEHRHLLELSLLHSGLPSSVGASFELTVYTGDAVLDGLDGATHDTLAPVTVGAMRTRTRNLSVPGMASLPDFAYTLWDWSSGNERCPPEPSTPALDCHNYETHIGWLNSNHMLPQSRKWYEHLHRIAIEKAQSCKTAYDVTPVELRPRYERYHLACERQALVIEGIAHHYLQDSWAIGHMWERWGSTEPGDFFGDRGLGFLVAGFTGLIHGAAAMLPSTPAFDDPMNAPHFDDVYVDGGIVRPGVGDIYLPELLGGFLGDAYAPQRRALFGCAVDGLRAVYSESARLHGTMQSPNGAEIDTSRSVSNDSCWSQRAANRAIAVGMGIHQGAYPGQVPVTSTALPLIFGLANVAPSIVLEEPITLDPATRLMFQRDAAYTAAFALARGITSFNGTDLASGGLPSLAGILPNSSYARGNAAAHVPPSAYADPFPPWRITEPDPDLARATVPLNLTFADANAADRCSEVTPTHLEDLRIEIALSDDSTPDEVRDARCGHCVQLTAPHLRFGVLGDHDEDREALCGIVNPGLASFVYTGDAPESFAGQPLDFDSLEEATRTVCGCSPIQASAGTFRNAAAGTIGTAFLVRLQPGGKPLVASTTLSVTGPPTWNGDQPLALTYPASVQRQFYTLAVAPVSGVYTIEANIGVQQFTAEVEVDAGVVLDPPQPVIADLTSTPGAIGSSWGAVPDASSYLTRVFDITNNKILPPVAFATSLTATLTVPIVGAGQKALQVFAFSNDMTPADPEIPDSFNVSFQRVILSASLVVSPASSTVAPNNIVGLTATVTGLASTEVTWSASGGGLAPSGNSAQWTAPETAGTYTVTATSAANSAFRGRSTLTVTGNQDCTPAVAAPFLAGDWYVTAWNEVASGGSCTSSKYVDFLEGGAPFNIDVTGDLTFPATLQSYAGGQFFCTEAGPVFSSGNENFGIRYVAPVDSPTGMERLSGTMTIRIVGANPQCTCSFCMVSFDAER